jgi:predicted secreted protein
MAEHTLTESDNGAHLTVRTGDTVTLHLSESSGAGYRWTAVSLDETRVSVEAHDYQAKSSAVGGAGTALWRLRAKLAGKTRVELKKSRPWESAESPGERFAIDLDITG